MKKAAILFSLTSLIGFEYIAPTKSGVSRVRIWTCLLKWKLERTKRIERSISSMLDKELNISLTKRSCWMTYSVKRQWGKWQREEKNCSTLLNEIIDPTRRPTSLTILMNKMLMLQRLKGEGETRTSEILMVKKKEMMTQAIPFDIERLVHLLMLGWYQNGCCWPRNSFLVSLENNL